MAQLKMGDYESKGDSKSLKNIDGQAFTIVKVEKSNYDDKGKSTLGVKLTTDEDFKDDKSGEKINKFHTTRNTIVKKFLDGEIGQEQPTELMNKINSGDTLKVKCEETKAKQGGNDYWILADA